MLKKIDLLKLDDNKKSGKLNDHVYVIDEESPDSREKWCWLIASQGNLRDSATENIPLDIFE